MSWAFWNQVQSSYFKTSASVRLTTCVSQSETLVAWGLSWIENIYVYFLIWVFPCLPHWCGLSTVYPGSMSIGHAWVGQSRELTLHVSSNLFLLLFFFRPWSKWPVKRVTLGILQSTSSPVEQFMDTWDWEKNNRYVKMSPGHLSQCFGPA